MKQNKKSQMILEDGCKIIEKDGIYSIEDSEDDEKQVISISNYLKTLKSLEEKK